MKHLTVKAAGAALLIAATLGSCADDKYDLSDIDTTAGIKVNDLTIPVNVDAITLSSVFNLKEDECIQIVDGEYAILKTGDFTSSEVNIKAISMDAPDIKGTYHDCNITTDGLAYAVSSAKSNFKYHSDQVSDCVVSIEELGTDLNIGMTLAIEEINSGNSTRIEDLELLIPKGLTLKEDNANYDKKTGIYKAGTRYFNGAIMHIDIQATCIDAEAAGIEYDYATHTVVMSGECGILKGSLKLSNMPDNKKTLHIIANYTMSKIDINEFSGDIQYDLTGTDFQEVDLSSLPDFLSQSETDIRLKNPQIYLAIDNPLYKYGLTARTGLTISAYDTDGLRNNYSLDTPGYFNINTNSSQREYLFCLSPSKPEKYYIGGSPLWVGYSSLSNVLSGDGLPQRLSINLDNPKLPVQHVSHIGMGVNLGAVTGKYTFFAPLELAEGSKIIYSDTIDGWSSDDLDALTISSLTITATADSNLPVNATLKAYPIDKNGHTIGNVEITGADIKAMSAGQELTIVMSGAVKMIDGVRFTVCIEEADSKTLTPDMSIKLSSIRAKVSGEYVKEL